MQKLRTQKGITLIALVITIIVMLILVGVSVTVALNGGLFTTAKKAAEGTASKRNEELKLSEGKVTINGEEYNSIDEYVNGGSSNEPTEPENPTGYEVYSVGDEVTIGGENFYVISNSDATQENVTLLAKDDIDSTLKQMNDEFDMHISSMFSNTNYWSSETEYPLNLNEYSIPEEVTTSAITLAKAYGAKVGGIGRLMTYEEAVVLENLNSDILYGTNGKSSRDGLSYWLATAYDYEWVWYVSYNYSDDDGLTTELAQRSYEYDSGVYVRPVVEISKSSIS